MGLPQIILTYQGQHFIDLIGDTITTSELAERLNLSGNTVRECLRKKGAIERGYVTDDDIEKYLPDASIISQRKASLALMARAW